MVGCPEYEFASVGLFVTRGDRELLRDCLLGYGYREDELGPELSRRFLTYTLLHRYSRLSWYLEFMPTDDVTTLEQMAQAWWAM